jgi:hypothetical protein
MAAIPGDAITEALNPITILEIFKNQIFGWYWFETGGPPAFLEALMKS